MNSELRSAAADNEDGGGMTSISDVFADMLHVNEDMIVAAAESQVEGDVEELVAYQRILHRDLMEMAEFIDSMFGVYSNSSSNNLAPTSTKNDELNPRTMVDLTVEADRDPKVAVVKKKLTTKKTQHSALLTAIEAGKKVRGVQRSKEQWIKSRDQVLEEEGVSAIMNKNATITTKVAKEPQRESEGLALANQLRAHEHVTEFLRAAPKEKAPVVGPPPMNMLLTNQLAMAVVPPPLVVPQASLEASARQPIRPSNAGNIPAKIALPPAHSMLNVLFAFPGPPSMMFNAQAAGLMAMPQWQPQVQTAFPARSVVPVRPPAKTSEFKRMCESCRKRHISVRECRLVHQHTDPEWQPAQPSAATRRRRRKEHCNTEQVA